MDRLNSALLIGLAVSLTFYHLLQSLVRYLTRAKFARDHKCQPEPRIPTFDPFFGLDGVIRTGKLFKERRVLKGLRIRHEELGNTYASFTGGGKNIFTCDVENIKSIWGTDFQKYGVEPTRRAAFEPSFGRGVSSSDGAFWEHSRAMIRPPLGRSNFANLPAFEMHLKNMLDHIPTDGSTIDLHPLFINLVRSTPPLFFTEGISELLMTDKRTVPRLLLTNPLRQKPLHPILKHTKRILRIRMGISNSTADRTLENDIE